jgi:hypothetical protein
MSRCRLDVSPIVSAGINNAPHDSGVRGRSPRIRISPDTAPIHGIG